MFHQTNILIVDDNSTNIQVAAGILEKNGFDTEYALSAAGAFKWLDNKDFDLILMDIMMPEMDGFDACKIIKATPQWANIPIIFLTARTDPQSLVKGFTMGGADYITKPFNVHELLVRVKMHIELKNSKAELLLLNQKLENIIDQKQSALEVSSNELIIANHELLAKNTELQKIECDKQKYFQILASQMGSSLHDITAMLQVIKLRVDSRKVAQMVDRIDHALMYLENMVNTAVRITELQSSDNHILVERFDINRLIGFSLFELDEKIRRKQIRFRNNIPADSFAVGETKLLKVGLLIIFDYFIERNEPNAIISIDFSHGNKSEVSIMVTDDGRILSDDEIEKAFNFFNIGSHSLSLAKQIAEAHEGYISIVSQHDKGICLTLSLFKTLNQIDSSE